MCDVIIYMELARFLKQRDIIFIICAGSISTQVVAIADLITTSFVVPVINNFRDKEEGYENASLTIKGIRVEHGKFMIAIIRLLILVVLLYLLFTLMY